MYIYPEMGGSRELLRYLQHHQNKESRILCTHITAENQRGSFFPWILYNSHLLSNYSPATIYWSSKYIHLWCKSNYLPLFQIKQRRHIISFFPNHLFGLDLFPSTFIPMPPRHLGRWARHCALLGNLQSWLRSLTLRKANLSQRSKNSDVSKHT